MNFYLPIAEISINIYVLLSLGVGIGFISGLFGIGGGFISCLANGETIEEALINL